MAFPVNRDSASLELLESLEFFVKKAPPSRVKRRPRQNGRKWRPPRHGIIDPRCNTKKVCRAAAKATEGLPGMGFRDEQNQRRRAMHDVQTRAAQHGQSSLRD